jgi:hypothetical protein
MPWWGWVLLGWLAVAAVAAVWGSTALRIAERRDRVRRQVDDAIDQVPESHRYDEAG